MRRDAPNRGESSGMSEQPTNFAPGDHVRFRDGLFAGFDADVTEIDAVTQTIHLSIPIYGRGHQLEFTLEEASRLLERDNP